MISWLANQTRQHATPATCWLRQVTLVHDHARCGPQPSPAPSEGRAGSTSVSRLVLRLGAGPSPETRPDR